MEENKIHKFISIDKETNNQIIELSFEWECSYNEVIEIITKKFTRTR